MNPSIRNSAFSAGIQNEKRLYEAIFGRRNVLDCAGGYFSRCTPDPTTAKVPAFPGVLANGATFTWPPMAEISSIRNCFPRIGQQ